MMPKTAAPAIRVVLIARGIVTEVYPMTSTELEAEVATLATLRRQVRGDDPADGDRRQRRYLSAMIRWHEAATKAPSLWQRLSRPLLFQALPERRPLGIRDAVPGTPDNWEAPQAFELADSPQAGSTQPALVAGQVYRYGPTWSLGRGGEPRRAMHPGHVCFDYAAWLDVYPAWLTDNPTPGGPNG